VDERCLGVGAMKRLANEDDLQRIAPIVKDFTGAVGLDYPSLMEGDFARIGPAGTRPFANKYVWER